MVWFYFMHKRQFIYIYIKTLTKLKLGRDVGKHKRSIIEISWIKPQLNFRLHNENNLASKFLDRFAIIPQLTISKFCNLIKNRCIRHFVRKIPCKIKNKTPSWFEIIFTFHYSHIFCPFFALAVFYWNSSRISFLSEYIFLYVNMRSCFNNHTIRDFPLKASLRKKIQKRICMQIFITVRLLFSPL